MEEFYIVTLNKNEKMKYLRSTIYNKHIIASIFHQGTLVNVFHTE